MFLFLLGFHISFLWWHRYFELNIFVCGRSIVITKAHVCLIGVSVSSSGLDIRLMALRAILIAFLKALHEPWIRIHWFWNVLSIMAFLGCINDCSPIFAPWLFWLSFISELKTKLRLCDAVSSPPVPDPVAFLGFAALGANV